MGFFGSSSKTYYNSTSTKLFEEVPSILTQTVKGAIAQNTNIADDLITNLVNGIGFKVNQLYNYASSGNYPWGLPEGTHYTYSATMPTKLRIIIERELNNPIHITHNTLTIDDTNDHIIYTVKYYLKDYLGVVDESIEYLWTYDESTGIYPILDLELEDIQDKSPYYPIIPIRVNGEYLVGTGVEHDSSITKACKYLGIAVDSMIEAMSEQLESSTNPVEDAYIVLGTEVTDSTEVGMNYLYTFFEHQLSVSAVSKEAYTSWADSPKQANTIPPYNIIQLKDSNYKMELSWLYIEESIEEGEIGTIGTHETKLVSGSNHYIGNSLTTYYSRDKLKLRKQISSTQYSEITVVGLTHSNWAVGKEIRTTLSDAFDDEDVAPSFIIPLRKDLIKRLGPINTHDLMYTSIRMVLNDKLKVRLKWYQTGLFRFAMMVVAVAISLWNPVVGAFVFSATAITSAIISLIVTQVILPIVLANLSDVLGEELALIVSLLVSYFAFDASAFTLGVQATSGAMNLYYAADSEKLMDAMDEVNDALEDVYDTLRETDRDVSYAKEFSTGENFALTDASKYVDIFKRETHAPLMSPLSVTYYTDVMRYLNQPDSIIRLGNTLT